MAPEEPPFRRLLLTGAAGGLGRVLRPRLQALCATLRVSDLTMPPPDAPSEERVACDLGDRAAVASLCRGVDAIVHFGGVSVEDRFDRILHANIAGTFNIGMGEKFDLSATKAMPAGAYGYWESGMKHYVWTKGETIAQFHGMGPWSIQYVNPADDPRNQGK